MCDKLFTDPCTLPCLHSLCFGCLESQKAMALTTSSDFRCHQCRAPFTSPALGGIGLYSCNTFIDSLVKSARSNTEDINRVIKCDLCENEDATQHCVECGENLGPSCLVPHKKSKLSATHQQIPLDEALAGNPIVQRILRCRQHIGSEIDTYCNTCYDAVCSKCLSQKHSGHIFCPLTQVTGPLQDQIAGYSITITKREEEARKAIVTLDGTINKIKEHHVKADKEVTKIFDALAVSLEERRVQVLQQMQDKGDQLRKTAIQEKDEAELATLQFREFHSFTEGLLAQGTPLEIVGTHKMVRA